MDPDLLGYLIDRYLPALVLYARQWCHAPEDVVQEAMIKLAEEVKKVDCLSYSPKKVAIGVRLST